MKDVHGIDLEIGQIVAIAHRSSTVAYQKSGRVIELNHDTNEFRVTWPDGKDSKWMKAYSYNSESYPRLAILH